MVRRTLLLAVILCLALPLSALAAKSHRVKKNESLHSLAKRYHVTVEELQQANNLTGTGIKAGDLLIIPPRSLQPAAAEKVEKKDTAGKAEPAETSASAEPAEKPAKAGKEAKQRKQAKAGKERRSSYTVRRGDTLPRIARKTGVSVAELKRLNGLQGSRVKAGQVLSLGEREERVTVADRAERGSRKLSKRFLQNLSLYDGGPDQRIAELTESTLPQQEAPLNSNVELNVGNVRQLQRTAYSFLGAHYKFGGSSRRALDCSSFTQQVFREMDVNLPRTAREQFNVGSRVPVGNLQKGDLVFFRTYARFPSHVGIYLGDNRMIHASSRDRQVVISTMDTPYYRSRYLGAKRIEQINPAAFNLTELCQTLETEAPEQAEQADRLRVFDGGPNEILDE